MMNHTRSCVSILVAAFAILAASCGSALAQAAPEAAPKTETLQTLVKTLEDDKARAQLVDQIRALIAAQQHTEQAPPATVGSRYLDGLATGLQDLHAGAAGMIASVADVSSIQRWLSLQIDDPQRRLRWRDLLLGMVAVGAGAVAAAGLAAMLLAGPRRRLATRRTDGLFMRPLQVLALLLLALLPVAAFAIGALAVLSFLDMDLRARLLVVAAVGVTVAALAVLRPLRAVIAPDDAALRQVDLSDATSRHLYIWVRRLVVLAAAGYFVVRMAALFQVPPSGVRLLAAIVGLAAAALVAAFILHCRGAVAGWLRGAREEGATAVLRRRLAEVWHVLALILVAGAFVVWLLREAVPAELVLFGLLKSAVVLVAAGMVWTGASRALRRAMSAGGTVERMFPRFVSRAGRYTAPILLAIRIVLVAVTAMILLEVWGMTAFQWSASPIGRRILSAAFGLSVIAVLAVVAWEAMDIAIERTLSPQDAGAGSLDRRRRLRTLLPLVRTAGNIALAAIVTMVVLAELGVNIGPLIAGAGVVGIAVGFGAQKLVQDVITGAFILMEDSISVGDVVKVGEHSGLVEAITIRTVRLRDLSGSVHTVPFSAVSSVVNMTKDFSHFVLDVGVAYREDTDQVVEVLKEIDAQMRGEPEFAQRMIAPIEVLGVDRFADSAVIVRARLKTKPIEQWTVGREFNRRMKKRFDELGIEIPFPHTTIYFGVDKQGAAPPAHLQLERAAPAARG
jgi:moderate conductance mechanosensitive channel